MRTRRSATPVPGFPRPGRAADPGQPDADADAATAAGSVGPILGLERLDAMGPRRALNTRVSVDLLERYARLLAGLRGDRLQTSMTEVVHALLHAGPRTQDELRVLIRDWRRARDADL